MAWGRKNKEQDYRVVIARLEARHKPMSGVKTGFLLGLGAIIMILTVIFENSAIRLAAWGAIWTGWNVLIGIVVLNYRHTDYIVYRENPPAPPREY